MNEPEFKWIRTDRNGRCTGCRNQVQDGDLVLWSLLEKRHIWCQDCGERSGVIPLPNPLPVSKGKQPTIRTSTTESYEAISTSPSLTTTVTTTTPTPTVPSREDKIAAAHAENMSANVALVAAVLELARQVEERSRLLKKQMEAKP